MLTDNAVLMGFFSLVTIMLALDLGILNRHTERHAMGFGEALSWTIVWFALALVFGEVIYLSYGLPAALEYYSAYIVEKSLSVDNLFVFWMIFNHFQVRRSHEHRILYFGVIGAMIMRAGIIYAGTGLVSEYHWLLYVMGGFLVWTSYKLLSETEEDADIADHKVVKFLTKHLPYDDNMYSNRFFVKFWMSNYCSYKWCATRLFLVLVVIEIMDLVFAVDSIPAVFAISQNPIVIYTSNIFAILGLRSMYFLLTTVIDRFYYLRNALAAILGFIGLKMLAADTLYISTGLSLSVIVSCLGIAVVASVAKNKAERK